MKRANWRIVVLVILVSALTSIVSSFASSALRSHKTTIVPNTFTAGEVASASAVNENFQALATAIDNGAPAWAWVNADGSIGKSGGAFTIAIHKVGTGEYCITNSLPNFAAVIATIQGGDLEPGFINANTGWGSDCNPYGGNGVFTANKSGVAVDLAFSVVIPAGQH